MQKQESFYIVAVLFVVVYLTAGCAKQDVVKKDEGITPAPVAKQVDPPKSNQPLSNATPPKQPATTSVPQVTPSPATAQQSQNVSSIEQLQSALEKIYFDFDAASLSDSARNTLTKNASVLMKYPDTKIRIEGNCDERGSAEYNMALGERRAKSAQKYLITLGVKTDRLSILSYGKEKPAVQGSDEAAWAKNRRDEFVVSTK